MPREDTFRAQDQFSLTDQSTKIGTLLDCTDRKTHLAIGATKSFMSKQY